MPPSLNSLERVRLALQCREPDRVPVVELGVHPNVIAAAGLGCATEAEFADAVELDCVTNAAAFAVTEGYADGTFRDEWGCLYRDQGEEVYHPIQGPIRRVEDIGSDRPPDPRAPHRLGLLDQHVARFKGRKAVYFHSRVAFMWSVYLAGMDNILM